MVQNPWTFVYKDGVNTKKLVENTHTQTHTNVLTSGVLVIFYGFVFPEKKGHTKYKQHIKIQRSNYFATSPWGYPGHF